MESVRATLPDFVTAVDTAATADMTRADRYVSFSRAGAAVCTAGVACSLAGLYWLNARQFRIPRARRPELVTRVTVATIGVTATSIVGGMSLIVAPFGFVQQRRRCEARGAALQTLAWDARVLQYRLDRGLSVMPPPHIGRAEEPEDSIDPGSFEAQFTVQDRGAAMAYYDASFMPEERQRRMLRRQLAGEGLSPDVTVSSDKAATLVWTELQARRDALQL